MAEGLLRPCSEMDGMNDCWHAFLRCKNHDKGQKGIHGDEGWSVRSLVVGVRMYDCVIEIMLALLMSEAGLMVLMRVTQKDGRWGRGVIRYFSAYAYLMTIHCAR